VREQTANTLFTNTLLEFTSITGGVIAPVKARLQSDTSTERENIEKEIWAIFQVQRTCLRKMGWIEITVVVELTSASVIPSDNLPCTHRSSTRETCIQPPRPSSAPRIHLASCPLTIAANYQTLRRDICPLRLRLLSTKTIVRDCRIGEILKNVGGHGERDGGPGHAVHEAAMHRWESTHIYICPRVGTEC
jgi:hypothetical protein